MKRSQFVPHLSDAISPPEFDPGVSVDAEKTWIECELNDVVIVSQDGQWDWKDDLFVWARNDDRSDWYADFDWGSTYIDDDMGVVEKVQDLIDVNIPMAPGKYRVCGDVDLTYEVSGAEYETTPDSDEYYEERVYFDDAVEVKYLPKESHVYNFKCVKISK